MLTVALDLGSADGSASVKLKIRKSNAKQMFNALNAPDLNGYHAVHYVVAANKHVIKNVLEELKAKDLPLLIITNLLRIVHLIFIDFIPFGGGIFEKLFFT